MTMNKTFWKLPWLSTDEKVGLHLLYISCIRFVVAKYGGMMETDADMRIASIRIPKRYTAACFEELKTLDLVKSRRPFSQEALPV
jgi:hypothetical protein